MAFGASPDRRETPMSFGGFGVSAGDAFALASFAWKIYKACEIRSKRLVISIASKLIGKFTGKSAQGGFQEISAEVATLHIALQELNDEVQNPHSPLNRSEALKRKELETILSNCNSTLNNLDGLLHRFNNLSSDHPRTIDRLKFGSKDLAQIRGQLTLLTSTIGLFLLALGTGSLGRIEQRLEEIISETRVNRREISATALPNEDTRVADVRWQELTAELRRHGTTSESINAHRNGIQASFQEKLERYQLPIRSADHSAVSLESQQDNRPKHPIVETSAEESKGINLVTTPKTTYSLFPLSSRCAQTSSASLPLPQKFPVQPLSDPRASTSFRASPPQAPSSASNASQRSVDNSVSGPVTEVQEFDQRGQLRRKTITRHSSNSSMRSSLASTHTSPSFNAAASQFSADVEDEQDLVGFFDSVDEPVAQATGEVTSSSRSTISPTSKGFSDDAGLECMSPTSLGVVSKDILLKQKRRINALQQSLAKRTLEKNYYKQQLEKLEANWRAPSFCSSCGKAPNRR